MIPIRRTKVVDNGTLKCTEEGGTQISTEVLRAAVEHLIETLAERKTEAAHLTEREVDVLRLMGNGDSNKIISPTLGITLDTTKKHIRNVIDKMPGTQPYPCGHYRGPGSARRQFYGNYRLDKSKLKLPEDQTSTVTNLGK